jgi:hypothetical protein
LGAAAESCFLCCAKASDQPDGAAPILADNKAQGDLLATELLGDSYISPARAATARNSAKGFS